MGTFSNATLGSGTLKWNNVDVGFLKAPVEFNFKAESTELLAASGSTAVLKYQGEIVHTFGGTLKAGLLEITPENAKIALGGITITETAADPVAVADTNYTFVAITDGDMERFFIGENIDDDPAPVLKTLVGGALVENTDYIIDYEAGYVYRNPGGAIASLGTIEVDSASYTPDATKELKLGAITDLAFDDLVFTHIKPTTGKYVKIEIPKACVQRDFKMSFAEKELMFYDITFKAIDDTANNPTYPLGRVIFEQ